MDLPINSHLFAELAPSALSQNRLAKNALTCNKQSVASSMGLQAMKQRVALAGGLGCLRIPGFSLPNLAEVVGPY